MVANQFARSTVEGCVLQNFQWAGQRLRAISRSVLWLGHVRGRIVLGPCKATNSQLELLISAKLIVRI